MTILLVGGLTFLPTLALGPIAEQLSLGLKESHMNAQTQASKNALQ